MKIRLYISEELILSSKIYLSKEHAHYLNNVLKVAVGREIIVFNENDGNFLGEFGGRENKKTIIYIKKFLFKKEKTNNLTLIFSLSKPTLLESIAKRSVELGVTNFMPFIMQHTAISKFNPEKFKKILLRLLSKVEDLI